MEISDEKFRDEILLKYLKNGYTIKQESAHYYRMWNNHRKLYLYPFEKDDNSEPEWAIGAVDTYTARAKWIERPKIIEE